LEADSAILLAVLVSGGKEMLLLPYEVDVPQDHRPVVNWLLIAATVAVFGWELMVRYNEAALGPFLLTGWGNPLGWITHMFLHGDIMHIAGNMIFLWVFGNAVCGKLGNIIYLPLYLLLGLVAAFTFMFFSSEPMLGASGAINGIVGMYLVFFPLNTITCAYFFWWFMVVRAGTFDISGYWMILLWLAFDIFGVVVGGDGVAYSAHFGGFAAGFVIAIILLKTKIVQMERDELSLLQVLRIDKRPELPEVDVLENEARRLGILTVSREAEAAEELAAMRRKMASSPPPPLEAAPRTQSAAIMSVQEPKKAEEVVRFSCACGKSIKAPARMAGARGKCPRCGETIRVPSKSDE
jgi:membrane associated rhomboid family serine protease